MKGEVAHHQKVGRGGEYFISDRFTFASLKKLIVDFLVELCKGTSPGRSVRLLAGERLLCLRNLCLTNFPEEAS